MRDGSEENDVPSLGKDAANSFGELRERPIVRDSVVVGINCGYLLDCAA